MIVNRSNGEAFDLELSPVEALLLAHQLIEYARTSICGIPGQPPASQTIQLLAGGLDMAALAVNGLREQIESLKPAGD